MHFGENFTRIRIQTSGAAINVVHGGQGSQPLLLLHGYPQTHVMWHRIIPSLAPHFHLICPDLRGYGDSEKPPSAPDHSTYSKRTMAADMAEVMTELPFIWLVFRFPP